MSVFQLQNMLMSTFLLSYFPTFLLRQSQAIALKSTFFLP